MTKIYEELIERINGEMPDLDRLVHRVSRAWSNAQRSPQELEIYLDSVALNLHGFYSGLERLFELIVRHVDQSIPGGEMWHRDLIQQMAQDKPNTRPAVISPNRVSSLDELRRFRHLVRNVYTFNLDSDKMKSLISNLPDLWNQVQAELLSFADFLSELVRAEQDT